MGGRPLSLLLFNHPKDAAAKRAPAQGCSPPAFSLSHQGSGEVPFSIRNWLGSDPEFSRLSSSPPPTPAAYHLPPTPRPAVTALQDSPSFQNCLLVSIATENVGGKQKCWTATSVGAERRRWNVGLSRGCRMRERGAPRWELGRKKPDEEPSEDRRTGRPKRKVHWQEEITLVKNMS